MRIRSLFSWDYMEWEDYRKRILDIEMLRFIDQTCKESINNFWKKEEKRWV